MHLNAKDKQKLIEQITKSIMKTFPKKKMINEISQEVYDKAMEFLGDQDPSTLPFNELFGDKMRVIIPLEPPTGSWLIDQLKSKNYEIDLANNLATTEIQTQRGKQKRSLKIGKAIQKELGKEAYKQWESFAGTLRGWLTNRGNKYVVMISRHPVDVVKMGEWFGHCHREDGAFFRCALGEAKQFGLVAYLVKKEELEGKDLTDDGLLSDVFRSRSKGVTPEARLRLRRLQHKETGQNLAIPEIRTYGGQTADLKDFVMTVNNWAHTQKKHFEEWPPKLDEFNHMGGHYKDTEINELYKLFFRIPKDTWISEPEWAGENVSFTPEDRLVEETNRWLSQYNREGFKIEVSIFLEPEEDHWGNDSGEHFYYTGRALIEIDFQDLLNTHFPSNSVITEEIKNIVETIYIDNNYNDFIGSENFPIIQIFLNDGGEFGSGLDAMNHFFDFIKNDYSGNEADLDNPSSKLYNLVMQSSELLASYGYIDDYLYFDEEEADLTYLDYTRTRNSLKFEYQKVGDHYDNKFNIDLILPRKKNNSYYQYDKADLHNINALFNNNIRKEAEKVINQIDLFDEPEDELYDVEFGEIHLWVRTGATSTSRPQVISSIAAGFEITHGSIESIAAVVKHLDRNFVKLIYGTLGEYMKMKIESIREQKKKKLINLIVDSVMETFDRKKPLNEISDSAYHQAMQYFENLDPDEIPFDNLFNGRMRVVIPLDPPEGSELLNQLKNKNYEIDLKNNIATTEIETQRGKQKRNLKIGKAIQKELGKKAYKQWEASAATLKQWSSERGDNYVVLISRHPVDVAKMGEWFQSCHKEGNGYFKCALGEAKQFGLVAYLIEKSELNGKSLQEPDLLSNRIGRFTKGVTPTARVRLRRLQNTITGQDLAIPETRTYGGQNSDLKDFLATVNNWAYEKQKNYYGDEWPPPLDEFVLKGGSYKDNQISKLYQNFFKTDVRHNEPYWDGEDDEESLWEEYQQEAERLSEQFNNRFHRFNDEPFLGAHFDAEVFDDLEAPYIDARVTIRIDFEKMFPGFDFDSNALEIADADLRDLLEYEYDLYAHEDVDWDGNIMSFGVENNEGGTPEQVDSYFEYVFDRYLSINFEKLLSKIKRLFLTHGVIKGGYKEDEFKNIDIEIKQEKLLDDDHTDTVIVNYRLDNPNLDKIALRRSGGGYYNYQEREWVELTHILEDEIKKFHQKFSNKQGDLLDANSGWGHIDIKVKNEVGGDTEVGASFLQYIDELEFIIYIRTNRFIKDDVLKFLKALDANIENILYLSFSRLIQNKLASVRESKRNSLINFITENIVQYFIKEDVDLQPKIFQRIKQLPNGIYVAIQKQEEDEYKIFYTTGERTRKGFLRSANEPYGDVVIGKASSWGDGPCLDGWEIIGSAAEKGWGPLLYDVAMEFASQKGGGLTPDRSTVSSDAYAVWLKYNKHRSDVGSMKLDNIHNPETPPKEDDCMQISAMKTDKKNWRQSPLARIYRKNPTTMRALKAAGKLILAL